MKFKFNSKYNTIATYVVIVFSICLLLVAVVLRYNEFIGVLQSVIKVFSPIIWGLVIAYLLNPIMVRLDHSLKPLINRNKEHKSAVRIASVAITSVFALACCTGLILMVVPELLNSINILIDNAPSYLNNFYDKMMEFLDNNPEISSTIKTWLEEEFSNIQTSVVSWITDLKPTIENLITTLKNGIFSVFTGVKDFLLGFIVSIYLLFNKEDFIAQSKKVLYATFSKKRCDKLLNIGRDANNKFMGFLSGKAIDSFIIGMLAFIVMTIMDMPYTVLISCIIGITNMIPFFGPIIGAVPSAFLILLYNPSKVIPFIIFIIILQQVDGNIIGPKILGNSIGLHTFWIIFAIFIGGGLFGFAGMLIGVPAFAVIYTLFKDSIDEKLIRKNMSTDIEDYRSPEPEIISHDNEEKKQSEMVKTATSLVKKGKDKIVDITSRKNDSNINNDDDDNNEKEN
jgi:predicted PurR-regulated permease PerM